MLQDKIEVIAGIVRRLAPVAYPDEQEASALPFGSRLNDGERGGSVGAPGLGRGVAVAPSDAPTAADDAACAPIAARPSDDWAALFENRLNALRAPGDEEPAVLHAEDAEHADRILADLCRDVPASEITRVGESPPPAKRDYAVGVTSAAALIAATGSVVIELPVAEDGYASLLVERHIVIADRGRLLPDLRAFYGRLSERLRAGESLPNQVCITGCSRTADVEKLLVVPAHGPRQVRVILCRAPLP